MTCAIVVSSKSGNTQLLADAVAEALASDGVELAYHGPIPQEGDAGDAARRTIQAADVVLAGFWTDRGDCTPEMASLLGQLAGKRVILFGTAGFGRSPAYFERILGVVRGHLPQDAEVAGAVMCQGKMGPGVRARYEAMLAEHPDDAHIKGMIENFDAALSHPDDADVQRVVAAVRAAL